MDPMIKRLLPEWISNLYGNREFWRDFTEYHPDPEVQNILMLGTGPSVTRKAIYEWFEDPRHGHPMVMVNQSSIAVAKVSGVVRKLGIKDPEMAVVMIDSSPAVAKKLKAYPYERNATRVYLCASICDPQCAKTEGLGYMFHAFLNARENLEYCAINSAMMRSNFLIHTWFLQAGMALNTGLMMIEWWVNNKYIQPNAKVTLLGVDLSDVDGSQTPQFKAYEKDLRTIVDMIKVPVYTKNLPWKATSKFIKEEPYAEG
jgi:hypothetical protein